jgi:hypothetical protein
VHRDLPLEPAVSALSSPSASSALHAFHVLHTAALKSRSASPPLRTHGFIRSPRARGLLLPPISDGVRHGASVWPPSFSSNLQQAGSARQFWEQQLRTLRLPCGIDAGPGAIFARHVAPAVARVVASAAGSQAVKGIVTAGAATAAVYAWAKAAKFLRAVWARRMGAA